MTRTEVGCPLEISFSAQESYSSPYAELELDIVVSRPDGSDFTVPAFWASDNLWIARVSSDVAGIHTYRTLCTQSSDEGLHGKTGSFEVGEYTGENPLYKHGRLRIASDKTHLEHRDGTPFFWMADTWWMGLCHRLHWPDEFRFLTQDRVDKGFNVVQIVAGLYPDMPPDYDPRGANEAGYPLNEEHSEINVDYFDMADFRIAHLVQSGVVPAIVGAWGYWLQVLGVQKMKKFWRYLVARWGASPVVWCIAGEATMPYYLSENKESDADDQRTGWTELCSYVRQIDGHGNVITIHPTQFGREQVDDPSVIDLEWLQTGHGGFGSVANSVQSVIQSIDAHPRMPVLVSEVSYEGILGTCWQDAQRDTFWRCVLMGACGHTYGANGIWQLNRPDKPFGASPHGSSWGDHISWQEAAQLGGSKQLGMAADFLRKFPWEKMLPHPEWVRDPWSEDRQEGASCAGIPGLFRVAYTRSGVPTFLDIESGVTYRGILFDPVMGRELDMGRVTPDESGCWTGQADVFHDWVAVLIAD